MGFEWFGEKMDVNDMVWMSKDDTYLSFNKMYFESFKGINLFVYFMVKNGYKWKTTEAIYEFMDIQMYI